ncbi:hypothetical protein VTJ04DRAFT_1097 [Mycothermus thermophilus]|uniref:uncharacterized protein n=1 Tax=Humicola insolens TaxID=85995 RepID=UPI003742E6C2
MYVWTTGQSQTPAAFHFPAIIWLPARLSKDGTTMAAEDVAFLLRVAKLQIDLDGQAGAAFNRERRKPSASRSRIGASAQCGGDSEGRLPMSRGGRSTQDGSCTGTYYSCVAPSSPSSACSPILHLAVDIIHSACCFRLPYRPANNLRPPVYTSSQGVDVVLAPNARSVPCAMSLVLPRPLDSATTA